MKACMMRGAGGGWGSGGAARPNSSKRAAPTAIRHCLTIAVCDASIEGVQPRLRAQTQVAACLGWHWCRRRFFVVVCIEVFVVIAIVEVVIVIEFAFPARHCFRGAP